ncbi:MAG: hypothetical protein SRB1_02693 [Desulfobacteraceae bacterium Eth-SRB1]|nr:MAG: hypothetical protein SRB1_02693 [Desulfobacteraceae bacterium Eth-SRB1]
MEQHKGYLSYAKKWEWLHKDYIISMITPKKRGRLKPFTEFMQKDDSEEVTRLFSLKKLSSFFGPESFITGIKENIILRKKAMRFLNQKVWVRHLIQSFHQCVNIIVYRLMNC